MELGKDLDCRELADDALLYVTGGEDTSAGGATPAKPAAPAGGGIGGLIMGAGAGAGTMYLIGKNKAKKAAEAAAAASKSGGAFRKFFHR